MEFGPGTTPKIIGDFCALALSSVAIGMLFGIFNSLLFKWCRMLCHSAITETLLLLIIAFLSYFISEAGELSGIISLLTCGITQAHYAWYNLSPQGKTISSVTFSILGSLSESFVFAYIGLCTFTYSGYAKDEEGKKRWDWSISFILCMGGIIIVGRTMAVWISHGLFSICAKTKDISLRELGFITWGGMIRGAIAFGLVLKIPSEADPVSGYVFKERGTIITTTLAVVIFTTVFFGSFMPVVQKILVPVTQETIQEYDGEPVGESIFADD